MTYVEWLRVRGVLKWTAILLVVLVALLLVLRISLLRVGSNDALSFVHHIESDSTSKVTLVTLPDGTKRTIIENAREGVRVVSDDRGYAGQHVEIYDRSPDASKHSHKTIAIGDLHVETLPTGDGTVTTVDTNRPEDLSYYAAIASFVALVVGTILGAPFARENDGHLEVALTKPVPRLNLALATVGVDVIGMIAAWVMTVVFLVIGHSLFEAPNYTYGPYDTQVILLGLVGAFAWYAMLCAATASMKRAYGTILGIAWPISIVLLILSRFNLGDSQLARMVHAIAVPLAWINPFAYLHFGPAYMVNGQPQGSMAVSFNSEIPMLVILALAYGAIAIFQWRRVEA